MVYIFKLPTQSIVKGPEVGRSCEETHRDVGVQCALSFGVHFSTPLTAALCISCNVFGSQKFPILQIVLFNFPVLKSLTLVKLFSCKSFNPLEPCANIHPHPSLREWLVQPKCNRGSKHDALDEVPSYVLLIHITGMHRLITY